LTKAKEVAKSIGATLVVPEFENDDGEPTDFNDLHIREGVEKVKTAFLVNKCNLQYTIKQQKEGKQYLGSESREARQQLESESNELQTFFYNQKNVRSLQTEGKILWILKDVCHILNISNPSDVAKRLNQDEKTKIDPRYYLNSRSNESVTAVTESGLYKVILQSRKPEALKFERWITHDVLPQICRHGAYIPQATVENAQIPEETKEKKQENAEISDERIPDGFKLTESALYYVDKRSGPVYLCSYLRVLSNTINVDTNENGKLLEFRTSQGEIRKICIKNKDLFSGLSQTILKELASAGLHVNLEAPTKKILVYLNNYSPDRSVKTTKKSGWCVNGFLTENGIITLEERGEDILLDTAYGSTYVAVNGSADDWKENVGELCQGNSRLVLAVSTAFAAPLLHVLDRPNFGVQLVGKSSAGKTTALYVAASVYGPRAYVKSWRATDNALETVAFNHNDMLLILDELGEMSPQKIGAAVYMLANGVGKTRANTSGEAKQAKTWRIALLAAGEVDLNTHMASAGFTTMAGQNIRLLPVPAVPEGCQGLIENAHSFTTPSALVKHLITATQRCYGAPLPEYIKRLIKNQEKIKNNFNEALETKKKEVLPYHADGHDNRVFDFFFTIGFAGELATEYGLTGWNTGEAGESSASLFEGWIRGKGGYGNQEKKMLLYSLRCFFQKYQYSRFISITEYNDVEEKTLNEVIGYRKNTQDGAVFYAYPERLRDALKREIAADINDILKLADELGILERADSKNRTKLIRIKNKVIRLLEFNNKILVDEG
jgi:putative DNA primase/helicase